MTGWSPDLAPPAHLVDLCVGGACRRHPAAPAAHLTRLRYDGGIPAPTGSVELLCCFDPGLGSSPERLLTECRRVLSEAGVVAFAAPAEEVGPALSAAGFPEWERVPADPVTARLASADHLVVAHRAARQPGPGPQLARETGLRARAGMASAPGTTIVVPVRDEERNLYAFFSFLERVTNHVGSRREFVVVVNGCTDDSGTVAADLAASSPLDVRVTTSAPGIVPAFRAGIAARTLGGFVGKLDADVIAHPFLLDALEIHLSTDPRVRVTHAEPLPSDSYCPFSEPEHRPAAVSRRRYFNGKASLYRDDPFAWPGVADFPERLRAEDVFFSFYLAFFAGLNAIGTAPGAVVYQKTIRTAEDLTRMVSRARSEIRRLTAAFPSFALLNLVFDEKVFSPSYRALLGEALARGEHAEEWLRLESTK